MQRGESLNFQEKVQALPFGVLSNELKWIFFEKNITPSPHLLFLQKFPFSKIFHH